MCMLGAVLYLGLLLAPQQDEVPGLEARVDARVELFSIIFRLAGNFEYNQPNSISGYSADVEDRFRKFEDHPVVRRARTLHKRCGVGYDAVVSMALHVEDTKDLKERIPFDLPPERLDSRWSKDEARAFLKEARDFVQKTGFNEFFAAHKVLYEAASKRMTKKVDERPYIDWFDAFFGARERATFHVIVGMLIGGCNYGSGIRFPDGSEEITPVLGVRLFDDDGIPVIADDIVPLVVHELCHSYTNAFVDRHADGLEDAGQRIYRLCADQMKKQAYGNWKTVLYESLVRACVVRYVHETDGTAAGLKEAMVQQGLGFKWVGELSRLLAEYQSKGDEYPDFEAFMPRVIAFFNDYANRYEKLMNAPPKVVSMIPANGAEDVDPALTEIRITFDRPMSNDCSVVGEGLEIPEIKPGSCYFKDSYRVFVMPCRLYPGMTYKFWLNQGNGKGFQSREGVPMEPVLVTFRTAKK